MSRRAISAALCLFLSGGLALPGQANDTVERLGDPGSLFSSVVRVGDTVYLSGMMAPPDVPADQTKGTVPVYKGDTKAQAIGALKQIQTALSSMKLGMGDVVQLTAFLTADPAKGGVVDFQGWNDAYRQFFGNAQQPNKPVRATVQVAGLAFPTGRIEIMVIAARPHDTAK